MNPHKQRLKKLYLRTGGAIFAFLVFVAMNINAILVGTEANSWGLTSIAPLVASYICLPKKIPRIVGADVAGDADTAMRLDRLVRFINWLRVGFLIVALFILVGLPRLVPAPT